MFLNFFLPPMMLFVGGFFIVKLHFFFFIHPIRTLKFTFRGENTKNAISSLILALAGTLGVGNIVGVSFGIAVGGAGSVFWLMVSALFSSAIKYAEVFLSAGTGKGLGMISVIEGTGKAYGKALSRLYALLCLALSLSMGCLLQGSAIRSAAHAYLDERMLIIPFTILAAFICKSGGERIKKAVAVIIPAAALCYTGMCLCVILPNISKLPSVLSLILSSALDIKSFAGGVSAFLVKSGMKEGFARGLLSNEAGAGTSSFSHTALSAEDCARAGCFGIIEVVFDTLFLCPLTAFAILFSGEASGANGLSGLATVFASRIGPAAYALLLFSVSAFALSTVLCWYYYGETCRFYLFGNKLKRVYFIVFLIIFAVSLSFDTDRSVYLTDTLLFLLCLISISALIKNSDRVKPPSEHNKF